MWVGVVSLFEGFRMREKLEGGLDPLFQTKNEKRGDRRNKALRVFGKPPLRCTTSQLESPIRHQQAARHSL